MSVKHWIIGGTLALLGVGSAAASTVAGDTQNASTATRVVSESAPSGGDTVGDRTRPGNRSSDASESTNDDAASPGEGPGGSSSRPASHPHRLGWQSLLPGSIQ